MGSSILDENGDQSWDIVLYQPFKYEAQTALFKDSFRTAQ